METTETGPGFPTVKRPGLKNSMAKNHGVNNVPHHGVGVFVVQTLVVNHKEKQHEQFRGRFHMCVCLPGQGLVVFANALPHPTRLPLSVDE